MSEIRRQAASWRNLEYNLDQMLKEVNTMSGHKWFDSEDVYFSKFLEKHLGDALCTVRTRFIQVLTKQVNEWSAQNEE